MSWRQPGSSSRRSWRRGARDLHLSSRTTRPVHGGRLRPAAWPKGVQAAGGLPEEGQTLNNPKTVGQLVEGNTPNCARAFGNLANIRGGPGSKRELLAGAHAAGSAASASSDAAQSSNRTATFFDT